jgi:hypothetical protein
MTTIPGHNQMLQQSSIVQELSTQGHASKPSPDQAAALQQLQEVAKGSTVQGAEESEHLKQETAKQKEKKELSQRQKAGKKKKRHPDQERTLDPDATGQLLDTTA